MTRNTRFSLCGFALALVLLFSVPSAGFGQIGPDHVADIGVDGQKHVDAQGHTDVQSRIMLPVVAVGENHAPIAMDITYQTAEDRALTVSEADGVLHNDTDSDNDSLEAELATPPAHGTVTLNADGSFTYTPDRDFHGEDSFTYRAHDGQIASQPAAVMITVTPINDTPVANDDVRKLDPDTTLTVAAADGVLANDTDADGDALQADLVDDVSHGTLNLAEDGAFTYTPDAGFVGQDLFTYTASDGSTTSQTASVTLIISSDDSAPLAEDDRYRTTMNTALQITIGRGVLSNDVDEDADPLEAVLREDVAHGTLTLNANGAFVYVPDTDFIGEDQFLYVADDGTTTSEPATVTISVERANQPPRIVSGARKFTKQVIDDTVDETHFAVAADLDNDGDLDIAATDYVDGDVMYYENDGNNNFSARVLDAEMEGAYPAAVGDVDGDGDADLMIGAYLGDTYAWYRNDGGGTLIRQTVDAAADGAHSIITIDLDADGDNDLVTANQDGDTISWYENDGAENFTLRIVDTTAIDAKRAEAADLDGDGDLDLMAAIFETDEIAWYENDGAENFTKRVIDTTANGAYYVTAADIDGDGDLDLFSASQYANVIKWHRNDGSGNFTNLFVDTDAPGARTVIAVDVDRDGDIDAVGNSVIYDSIAWYENDGTGSFTERTVDNNVDGAYGVSALDMDRDGDIDMLSAGRDDDRVSLYTQSRTHSIAGSTGEALVLAPTVLNTVDDDNGPEELTYTIIEGPTAGVLALDNTPLSVGGQFTQADVDRLAVTYLQESEQPSPDQFTYTVVDSGLDGVQPATGLVNINMTGRDQVLLELPLDEGSGTIARDRSDKGNDGTLANGAMFVTDTGDGSASAVSLDGEDDYIDLGTLDAPGAGLTVALRFNADRFPGAAADPRLISKASGTAADDHIFMLSTIRTGDSIRLRARLQVESGPTTLIAASGNLTAGVWYHAALTYDGATLRLFLDGTEVGRTDLSGFVLSSRSMGVAIGAQPPGAGGGYFDGRIDDVRILTRPMTDDEITQLAGGG